MTRTRTATDHQEVTGTATGGNGESSVGSKNVILEKAHRVYLIAASCTYFCFVTSGGICLFDSSKLLTIFNR
jgi:hypothetical protein